jgi:DNA-binding HxlR family transcriptional regulator
VRRVARASFVLWRPFHRTLRIVIKRSKVSPASPAVPPTATDHRSGCPINLTLEAVGDRWSLIVIRDIMFGNRRHYRELLNRSEEGIASNILAQRLKRLVAMGLLSRRPDPAHQQKTIYSLTEPAIELVPLLAQLAAWGRRHTAASSVLSVRAELLEKGGKTLWDALMTELRALHLGAPRPRRSALAQLEAAYERARRHIRRPTRS